MSYHSGATEILPGLWLGDITSAHDPTFIKDKQIQFIINCSNETKFPNNSMIKMKHQVQIPERLKPDEYPLVCRYLDEYCLLIKRHINMYNILIYCQTGIHKSPIIMIMYLMRCGLMDINSVTNCLKTKRTDICDLMNNYQSLLKFYQKTITRS